MNERNRKQMEWLIGAVTVIGLAVSFIAFIWRVQNQTSVWLFVWVAVYYGFAFYYALKGYKKPHGNMVQIMMLVFAGYLAVSVIAPVNRWSLPWFRIISSNFAVMFIAFMAGRLNKVEENKLTAGIVSALLLIRCVWFLEQLDLSGLEIVFFMLDRFVPLFIWVALVLIYFYRYQAHKEAGLADEDS